MKIRINKFLASAGICSRRAADKLIVEKKVTINGKIAKLGDQVDDAMDSVTVNQKPIKKQTAYIYYAVNKPIDYTSSSMDRFAKHLVISLVPEDSKVFPVGRLDKNSEGLMILTNDGEMANILTHPKFMHEKEYEVIATYNRQVIDKKVLERKLEKLERGVRLNGQLTSPAKINSINWLSAKKLQFNITIQEGRKRQIRRMCDIIGLEVNNLKRVRIGKLKLDNLTTGKYKIIDKSDIL